MRSEGESLKTTLVQTLSHILQAAATAIAPLFACMCAWMRMSKIQPVAIETAPLTHEQMENFECVNSIRVSVENW